MAPHTAVIFVHGFISGPTCWDPFIEHLHSDAESFPKDQYTFARFGYATALQVFNPLRRLPRLKELGQALDEFLMDYQNYPRLVLVGHSQGGLVIQSYLVAKLEANAGESLAKIRNIVLFATPNFGSIFFSGLRRLLFALLPNSQEATLRALSAETGDICRRVERDILRAVEVTPTTCPIPFKVFWGEEDNVVLEVSARGCFDEGSPLPGDHSGILHVSNGIHDRRYRALYHAILNPPGHPALLEVDCFEVKLSIEPWHQPVEIRKWRHDGVQDRAVRTMSLRLSPRNRCRSLYKINYRSTQGFVQSLGFREPNLATGEELYGNENSDSVFNYAFQPEPFNSDQHYFATLEIFNGFGPGNRAWHHHLTQNLRCRVFRLSLDLSGYLRAGFSLEADPRFSYFPGFVEDHSLCAARPTTSAREPISATSSEWVWELSDLCSGVVDLAWEWKTEPLPEGS